MKRGAIHGLVWTLNRLTKPHFSHVLTLSFSTNTTPSILSSYHRLLLSAPNLASFLQIRSPSLCSGLLLPSLASFSYHCLHSLSRSVSLALVGDYEDGGPLSRNPNRDGLTPTTTTSLSLSPLAPSATGNFLWRSSLWCNCFGCCCWLWLYLVEGLVTS